MFYRLLYFFIPSFYDNIVFFALTKKWKSVVCPTIHRRRHSDISCSGAWTQGLLQVRQMCKADIITTTPPNSLLTTIDFFRKTYLSAVKLVIDSGLHRILQLLFNSSVSFFFLNHNSNCWQDVRPWLRGSAGRFKLRRNAQMCDFVSSPKNGSSGQRQQ